MKKEDLYKKLVLGLLFVFPIVVYLFFASGKNNFAKLPILSKGVNEILAIKSNVDNKLMLRDHITILGYWGGSLQNKQAEALNLMKKSTSVFMSLQIFNLYFLLIKIACHK